jgi:hypothetical protein
MNFTFPKFIKTDLKTLIPAATEEAIDLMEKMMIYEPQKRPSAQ